jgi:8-oxo-dGTP pyrophosphatase MutT (NUDIX family)
VNGIPDTMTPRATDAVRPRDAASLVLLRRAGQVRHVLMGRRARHHRFLPDFYVFPGGGVDAADSRAPVLTALRPEVAACLGARAHALAVAAVRETYEETGVTLGALRGTRLLPALDRLEYIVRAITPVSSPIRFHARFFLAEGDFDGALAGNGELLDLGWRPIDACLALPIADITEFVLREVAQRLGGQVSGGIPLFSFRNGRAAVRRGPPALKGVR